MSRTLLDSEEVRGSQVVIYDTTGAPVLVAIELPSGGILVTHRGDADFDHWLHVLGLKFEEKK